MFRKVSKKRKQLRSKIVENDDDDDEETVETSIQDRIQQIQKKHKLLASLPVATGEIRNPQTKHSSKDDENNENDDDAPALTVLETKHKKAMEDFISQNLGESTTSTEDAITEAMKKTEDPEAALYEELAAATVPSQILGSQVDDGASKAMLVGGTGLAEVILPKDKVFKNSNQARVRYSRNPHASSAVPSGERTLTRKANASLPAASSFRSMVHDSRNGNANGSANVNVNNQNSDPHTLVASNDETIHKSNNVSESAPSETLTTSADTNRPGFAALRGKVRSHYVDRQKPQNNTRGHQHQKDRDAFTKFVKRQRNMR